MPVSCNLNTEWKITLLTEPVPNPPRGGVLLFNITKVTGEDIEGDVSEFDGGAISKFTGTCRAILPGHLHTLSFEFQWASVDVVMTGVAFPATDEINEFRGRFRATARTDVGEADAALVLLAPPESGDTGTGNGTQT